MFWLKIFTKHCLKHRLKMFLKVLKILLKNGTNRQNLLKGDLPSMCVCANQQDDFQRSSKLGNKSLKGIHKAL